MKHRQVFGVFALLCILAAALAGGPGCGDDSPGGAADTPGTTQSATAEDEVSPPPPITASTTSETTLSPEQQIERIGNSWAPLFAIAPNPDACAGSDAVRGSEAAEYMGQPACEQIACERPGHRTIRNCTPLSPGVQKSFGDATVQDVAIKGDRAAARFSNGEVVELEPTGGAGADRNWIIVKVGGTAGSGVVE